MKLDRDKFEKEFTIYKSDSEEEEDPHEMSHHL